MSKEHHDKIYDLMVHYIKVNILGNSNVGKSTLISNIEQNYTDKVIAKKEESKPKEIENPPQEGNGQNGENEEKAEKVIEPDTNLIEQIKRIKMNYEKEEYNIICYETNLDNFEFIKKNLEAILTYSECIILMIDISSAKSFSIITQLMTLITEIQSTSYDLKEIPIILLNNKTDLEASRDVSGFEVKEFLDKYPNIINIELSLLSKENFEEFMKKFIDILKKIENLDKYDAQHLVKIQDPPIIPKDRDSIQGNITEASLNLFFLGSTTVGKTTFIKKFFKFDFMETTLSTLGIDVEKTIAKVGSHYIKIEMWDTAGQERLRSIPKKYYSKGDGFLLLFDVTNKSSYDDVTGWIKDIREARGNININGVNDANKSSSNEVLFLIGNKIDNSDKRVVSQEDAKALARTYGLNYFEVSCMQGINVYEVTTKLIFEAFSFAKGNSDNESFSLKKAGSKRKKKGCC